MDLNTLSVACRFVAGVVLIAFGLASGGIWAVPWIIAVVVILTSGQGAGAAAVYGAFSCAPLLLLLSIFSNICLAFVSAVVLAPALIFITCSIPSK